ncbi:unnamed protein product [Rotaria sp. Silwood1]|nr:unnamed protein product [Rotaria sp. Silwood1]
MLQSNIFTSFHYTSKQGRKKQNKDNDQCLVCGDTSVGINFGVYTCSPCKAFFRRNATKLGAYEFTCYKDGDCPITCDTRQKCSCCRLAKCFRVGMNSNAIRTEDEKLERNQLIAYNRQKRMEKTGAISPVILLKHSQRTHLSLSSNDQTLLANIFNAYEKTCVSLRFDELLKIPNDTTLSLQTFMNSFSHMYVALIDYFKSIPEFSNLSTEIKIGLLKSNLNQTLRLNNVLVMQATGVVDDINSIVFKNVFPIDLFIELCHCSMALMPFVYDPIFLKLIFIVLIFSTSLSIRYDTNEQIIPTKTILSIQNVYIELLWRYMLYRCSTYRESIGLLTSFITRLLHSQTVGEKLSQYINKIISNHVDQLEPIMKSMWCNEKN